MPCPICGGLHYRSQCPYKLECSFCEGPHLDSECPSYDRAYPFDEQGPFSLPYPGQDMRYGSPPRRPPPAAAAPPPPPRQYSRYPARLLPEDAMQVDDSFDRPEVPVSDLPRRPPPAIGLPITHAAPQPYPKQDSRRFASPPPAAAARHTTGKHPVRLSIWGIPLSAAAPPAAAQPSAPGIDIDRTPSPRKNARETKCIYCSYESNRHNVTQKVTALKRHQNGPVSDEPFFCFFYSCNYTVYHEKCFHHHLKGHKIGRYFHCDFPRCSYKSLRPSDIKKHMQRIHEPKKHPMIL